MKKLLRRPMAFLLIMAMLLTNMGLVSAMAADAKPKEDETKTEEASEKKQVAMPTADPKEGNYDKTQKVTLKTTTKDAVIYYTTDGKEPTAKSTKFDTKKPVEISKTTTVKAIAVKKDMKDSKVATFKYTIGDEKDADKKDTDKKSEDDKETKAKETPVEDKKEEEVPSTKESNSEPAVKEMPAAVTLTTDVLKIGYTDTQVCDKTKYTFAEADQYEITDITASGSIGTLVPYNITMVLKALGNYDFTGFTSAQASLNGTAATTAIVDPMDSKMVTLRFTITLNGPVDDITPSIATTNTATGFANMAKVNATSTVAFTSSSGDNIVYKVNGGAETTVSGTLGQTTEANVTMVGDANGICKVEVYGERDGAFTTTREYYYIMNLPALQATLPAGTYEGNKTTQLSYVTGVPVPSQGVTIHYTTDGSEPTRTSGEYTPGTDISIPGPGTFTLKARVFSANNEGALLTAVYTITSTPTQTPPSPTAKPATKIKKVEITNLKKPSRGAKPDREAKVAGEGYEIASITWRSGEVDDNQFVAGDKVASGKRFKAGTAYGVYVKLKVKSGYEFDTELFKKSKVSDVVSLNCSGAPARSNLSATEVTISAAWNLPSGIAASADNNTITGLKSSYALKETISFTMTGDDNEAEDGNERYIPVSYKITNGTQTLSNVDLKNSSDVSVKKSTSIATAGTYTLTATYQKQIYDAEAQAWLEESDGTATKTASVRVGTSSTTKKTSTVTKAAAKTTAKKSTTSKAKTAKTGDETPIGAIVAVLVLAGAAVIILVVRKKKGHKEE